VLTPGPESSAASSDAEKRAARAGFSPRSIPLQPKTPSPAAPKATSADEGERAEVNSLLHVRYSTPDGHDRLCTFRLVPYSVGPQVRDAVSVRGTDGAQFLGKRTGDVSRGALFGGPVGTLCVLRLD
jgi:hypothetical protein